MLFSLSLASEPRRTNYKHQEKREQPVRVTSLCFSFFPEIWPLRSWFPWLQCALQPQQGGRWLLILGWSFLLPLSVLCYKTDPPPTINKEVPGHSLHPPAISFLPFLAPQPLLLDDCTDSFKITFEELTHPFCSSSPAVDELNFAIFSELLHLNVREKGQGEPVER